MGDDDDSLNRLFCLQIIFKLLDAYDDRLFCK